MATAPDYALRIAPLRLELAPGKVIETFAYNGTVPGPVLRLREGRQVSIDIRNDTDMDDIMHWHGLYLPVGSRWCDGGRIADGGARRHAALHVRGEARRHALVPQPQHGRDRSEPKLVFRDVRLPDRRAGERSRPLRSGSAAGSPPLGGLMGQHAGSSVKVRRPTTASR